MRQIFLLSLLAVTLAASPVHWYKNYPDALNEAKKTNKILMLFLTRPGCKSCAYMRDKVFTDKKVLAYVGTHYVAAELLIHAPSLPKEYWMKFSPVFTFIDPKEEEIVEQLIGGKDAPHFLEMLKRVQQENPQLQ